MLIIEIIIDNREQKRIKTANKYYSSKNHTVQVKQNPIGDYIFTNNNNQTCVFEYKTCNDFIHSVLDKRVFNQALRQSENFDYHFVIIECTEKLRKKLSKNLYYSRGVNFSKAQFYGAIARLNTYTTVLTAENEKDCFRLMESQAIKCFDNKKISKRFSKNKGSPAFRVLYNIVDGVGEKTAERIVEDLDLTTIQDVINVDKKELMNIRGVSDKKADNIIHQLRKELYRVV